MRSFLDPTTWTIVAIVVSSVNAGKLGARNLGQDTVEVCHVNLLELPRPAAEAQLEGNQENNFLARNGQCNVAGGLYETGCPCVRLEDFTDKIDNMIENQGGIGRCYARKYTYNYSVLDRAYYIIVSSRSGTDGSSVLEATLYDYEDEYTYVHDRCNVGGHDTFGTESSEDYAYYGSYKYSYTDASETEDCVGIYDAFLDYLKDIDGCVVYDN